jgi:hypothetical protein
VISTFERRELFQPFPANQNKAEMAWCLTHEEHVPDLKVEPINGMGRHLFTTNAKQIWTIVLFKSERDKSFVPFTLKQNRLIALQRYEHHIAEVANSETTF